jgi:hypothetical protein
MKTEAIKLKSKSEKFLNLSMFITMGISLIIISIITFTAYSNCNSVQIKSKRQMVNKYFYQLSNGSQVWSDQDFALNEQVCVSTPNQVIAQK